MSDIARVLDVYKGSNGDATKALYAELQQLGPSGNVAMNLFRACKASERAKAYRGRRFKGHAYEKKEWSLGLLCDALSGAAGLGIIWGWGIDEEQPVHRHVLYVELPTGQVSFHGAVRLAGPTYPHAWDGMRGRSADRICRYVARILATAPA